MSFACQAFSWQPGDRVCESSWKNNSCTFYLATARVCESSWKNSSCTFYLATARVATTFITNVMEACLGRRCRGQMKATGVNPHDRQALWLYQKLASICYTCSCMQTFIRTNGGETGNMAEATWQEVGLQRIGTYA